MELLVPAAAAALIALPLILFLYFLKVRRPEVRVATLMFWRPHIIDRQANAPWQRLRWSLLLLLQLAAALLLALSLTRPGLAGVAGVGQTTVVLIDGSPSMQATDVSPSRFVAAVNQARSIAGQLGPGQQMAVVLLGEHAQLLAPPSSDPAVLNAALDRAHVAGRGADLGEGISLANAILSGRRGGTILLLGDGHARPPDTPTRVAAPLDYVPFGNTGENAGIEALTRDSQGSVFLRVADYGRLPRDLKVELRADGRLADVLPLHVDGNSVTDLRWNRLPPGTSVLEARLTPGDVFAPDDLAWLVTAAPPAHKVLVVTQENGFLVRALKLRAGLEVTVLAPKDYKPGAYDLYVFDGFVPKGKLPTPALVVGPPVGEGPVPAGPPVDPGGVLPANPNEPLLRDVVLKDVHVLVASKVTPPADWRTVIAATDAALLLVREGEPRMAELTFDIHHSDLPLRAAFPILVQNLVQYLLPGGFENQVYAPGQAIALAAEPDARSLEVTTPDGRTLRLAPPFPVPPLTDTLHSGVYTVRQQLPSGVRVSQFVVQLQDPTQSRIAVGSAPLSEQEGAPKTRLPRGTLEIWPWLAAAALA
ncbi:MAG TPA: VWA domain-containing protein, partial [Candidatus Acidoferrales bacterium]|nr:VWA domain-containing protein [Candidatus Acidoferrales bacterium]